jgi:RES domain-containing protein
LKAWRITNKDYVADAFSGKGAFLYAGRWNSAGVRLVYLGGTPSISVLETLVNVPSLSVLATLEFVLIPVDFEDSLIGGAFILFLHFARVADSRRGRAFAAVISPPRREQ